MRIIIFGFPLFMAIPYGDVGSGYLRFRVWVLNDIRKGNVSHSLNS